MARTLLQVIRDLLTKRGTPLERLALGFKKRNHLTDDEAEKAAEFYLRYIAQQIEASKQIVILDREVVAALEENAGSTMEADAEKFQKLLTSDLVNDAVKKATGK